MCAFFVFVFLIVCCVLGLIGKVFGNRPRPGPPPTVYPRPYQPGQ